MNLEDVISPEYGLQQDDWSLSKPTFGKEGQLEVIGWSGKYRRDKYYTLKCHTCAKDTELHGEGVFRSTKVNLQNGQVPCGCSKRPSWSNSQYTTLCKRAAEKLGHTFTGFAGEEWNGRDTKITLVCDTHGEWNTGRVCTLINKGMGCPGCMTDAISLANTKPDETMIASFMASGSFHPDTKFWRSKRLNSCGRTSYWHILCPECGETGESLSGSLQQGQRPCACSKQRQQEAYINWLVDDNYAVALKFGIARDSKQRIKSQDRNSVYEVRQYQVFTFPDVSSCKAAERECKKELVCGVVSKTDMVDGYTETTSVLNLNKVRVIYEKYGGVLNEEV